MSTEQLERLASAEKAIEAAGTLEYQDADEAVIDLITNLLHWLKNEQGDINTDRIFRICADHYNEEGGN